MPQCRPSPAQPGTSQGRVLAIQTWRRYNIYNIFKSIYNRGGEDTQNKLKFFVEFQMKTKTK